jgi:hypothetical protein
MRAMLASGMIHGSTFIWREGMESWLPLARHPEWAPRISSSAGVPISGYGGVPPTNGMAIASMVCGLVSLPMMLGCWLGIVVGIPAVICGHIALSQMKHMAIPQGRGLAITGLITGYLSIGLTLLVGVVFGILIARDIH